LAEAHDGIQDIAITEGNIINKPLGLTVNQIDPRMIKLKAYAMTEVELPVKVRTEKSLPPNLILTSMTVEPEKLRMMVPQSRKEEFASIHTETVNLDDITQSAILRVKVVMPELSQPADNTVAIVKVKIDVKEIRKKGK
jgi:YbbR domain-containing protein